jgi:hypothetical protein
MASFDSDVDIRWACLPDGDPRWHASGVLYAYVHDRRPVVYYLGKAWTTTVGERWDAPDKVSASGFWPWYSQEVSSHHRVYIGEIETDMRLTHELLGDLESLLINAYKPGGNGTYTKTRGRYWREGLIVRNLGSWPYRSRPIVIDSRHEVRVCARLPRR